MRTMEADEGSVNSIKKPKTHRYPSLKGTDPKFRRNHRHALHGTMRALKEAKEVGVVPSRGTLELCG